MEFSGINRINSSNIKDVCTYIFNNRLSNKKLRMTDGVSGLKDVFFKAIGFKGDGSMASLYYNYDEETCISDSCYEIVIEPNCIVVNDKIIAITYRDNAHMYMIKEVE